MKTLQHCAQLDEPCLRGEFAVAHAELFVDEAIEIQPACAAGAPDERDTVLRRGRLTQNESCVYILVAGDKIISAPFF